MGNYIGKYSTSGDVQTAVDNGELLKPYVALVGDTIDFNSYTYNAREHYLTFQITGNGVINWKDEGGTNAKTIQYRKNGGNWISITSSFYSTAPKLNVVAGDILEFKGDNSIYGGGNKYTGFLNSTAQFKVKGNIMSLINSTGYTTATTLTNYCYANMFQGCTGLTDASNLILPATTLTSSCYAGMFQGCSSLTQAPALPATTLAKECYSMLFYGCTSLNYIKCLATDISATDCTWYWVSGVQTTSGTFVTPSTTNWSTGNNGIPTNWTRVNSD